MEEKEQKKLECEAGSDMLSGEPAESEPEMMTEPDTELTAEAADDSMECVLPVIALRGMTVFPGAPVHFDVSREKSVQAVRHAMQGDRKIFLVMQRQADTENPGREDLFYVGTIAEITQVMKLQKGAFRVLVEGTARAELLDLVTETPYLEGRVEESTDWNTFEGSEILEKAFIRTLTGQFQEYSTGNGKIPAENVRQITEEEHLPELMNRVINQCFFTQAQKQQLLEEETLRSRFDELCALLGDEIEIHRIQSRISEKVKRRVDKGQRDYILREQLKVIREELGEENFQSDADGFAEAADKLPASDEVKEKIHKAIRHFRAVANNPAESSVLRGYIETLLEMPWDNATEDCNDIAFARKVLKEDHYGLEKVKERILEFLTVRLLTKGGDAPVICLAGPPGTGKTSIAQSVARCMNRKYVRISLGGVRDEAEIRGHRRTYVGALPGRIATGMKEAGVKNPVMLLDEIDKVGTDSRGDTASALLEVLDGEQNGKFHDHYMEIPLDLSEVFFLTTANDISQIPKPLLDRMEIIELSGYTDVEKFHIAKEHLIPKQIRKHGLEKNQLRITDETLYEIIHGYTREAGVRSLERQIGALCRKAAVEIVEKKRKLVRISRQNLEKFLGPVRYVKPETEKEDRVGIVTGLAWTSVGGVTLEIEVAAMPGNGQMILTGSLGDVMKESARTALSYVRSVADETVCAFDKTDFHIHIPEGAVPKDGPSAGITMATALYSAACGTKVRSDVAMTGEVTLTGRVLPIGGLKEKLLAAKRAEKLTVLVPEDNRRDVEDFEEDILSGLEIIFVRKMEDVLANVLRKE